MNIVANTYVSFLAIYCENKQLFNIANRKIRSITHTFQLSRYILYTPNNIRQLSNCLIFTLIIITIV